MARRSMLGALLFLLLVIMNILQQGNAVNSDINGKPSMINPKERNFLEKQLNLAEALLIYEKAKSELQELKAQESIDIPQIQKRQGILENAADEQPLPRFESKRRMNEVFHHPRLQSLPTYRQSVDFDDSSTDSSIQPQFRDAAEIQNNPKPPLTLTLGGYQRPYDRQQSLSPINIENSRSLQTNRIIPHVIYNDQPIRRIPGMGYEPPIAQPELNPNTVAYFSGFGQNQPSPNRVFQDRTPITVYPYQQASLPTRRQNPERSFYVVNNPFGYPSSALEPNLQENVAYQPIQYPLKDKGPIVQERSNVLSNPSNFFGGPSAPRQVNPYTIPFSNYQDVFLFPQQQRTYPFNQYPISINTPKEDRKTEVAESESISQEQQQPDNINTYRQPNPGYIDPASSQSPQNVTVPSSRQIFLPPQNLYNPFRYNFEQPSTESQTSPPTFSDNNNNGSFLMDEYLKYLRSPLPPPFLPDFYPNSQRDPRQNDERRILPSRDNDNTNATSQGRSIGPSSVFEFFNLQRPSTRTRIDPSVTPKCAKDPNVTICFDDEEYPMTDILFKLDSEALMLRRLLPRFPFEGAVDANVIQSEGPSSGETTICKVSAKFGQPKRALDSEGKWKVIVNVGDNARFGGFAQNVRIETCSNAGAPCSHTDSNYKTQCVQKDSLQRFLTWDHERGLHMSLIKLPVACVCQLVN